MTSRAIIAFIKILLLACKRPIAVPNFYQSCELNSENLKRIIRAANYQSSGLLILANHELLHKTLQKMELRIDKANTVIYITSCVCVWGK